MYHRKRAPLAGILTLVIVAIAGSSFLATAGFAKSSKRVSITVQAKQKGTSISGRISGTLGSGTQVGKATSATAVSLVWHLKGGTISVAADGKLSGGTKASGTWKIVGGTGKFKGISGGGPQVGDIKTLVFRYTGTVRF